MIKKKILGKIKTLWHKDGENYSKTEIQLWFDEENNRKIEAIVHANFKYGKAIYEQEMEGGHYTTFEDLFNHCKRDENGMPILPDGSKLEFKKVKVEGVPDDPYAGLIGDIFADVQEEYDDAGNLHLYFTNYDAYGHENSWESPKNPFAHWSDETKN